MALRAGYYGLKRKLFEKVLGLPAIKSIGDGLLLNSTTGVLSATGGGGGTTVVANPEGDASEDLEKLQVGETVYDLDFSKVSIDTIGTASATATRTQKITIGDAITDIAGSKYMETTTKTTAGDIDTFSFSNSAITIDSAYDVFCDVYGVAANDVVISNGSADVKFKSSDNVTKCRLYIRG